MSGRTAAFEGAVPWQKIMGTQSDFRNMMKKSDIGSK